MVRQRQLLLLGILLLVSLLGERNALGAEIQESLAGDSHGANGSGLGGTHAHDVEVELQGNRGSDVGPWLTWFLKVKHTSCYAFTPWCKDASCVLQKCT
jgi:hypothetical protein